MKKQQKYFLQCKQCNQKINHFSKWFQHGQRCPACGSNMADIKYLPKLPDLYNSIYHKTDNFKGLWYYFDFLPLDSPENIITGGEGIVPIDRWPFIEAYAKDVFNIKCKVYAHRHDNNYATGTFKDLAGSVVASVLHENGIKNYVVASTGNIGVAYSRYLSAANITIYAFIPNNASKTQEAEISCFGQKVFRVNGDYHSAKELALEFAQQEKFLLAAGNFDPNVHPWQMRGRLPKAIIFLKGGRTIIPYTQNRKPSFLPWAQDIPKHILYSVDMYVKAKVKLFHLMNCWWRMWPVSSPLKRL
jgi:threonine synthase